MNAPRNPTRPVRIGSVTIGGGRPIVVQSMCTAKAWDVEAAVRQIDSLWRAGAGVVRVAVDSRREADALKEIRQRSEANLAVDLQESYQLAADVAPFVDKIRYNPGHLYHHQRSRPWQDKVRFLADVAGQHDCAIRVGVNCGSVDPAQRSRFAPDDWLGPMLASALEHCERLDSFGFTRYCVSLKDSDPRRVVEVNRRFAAQRPDVPLHLGVTEAGMPPEGIAKTRMALEQLISRGIGDTIRVSLTVPGWRKHEEVEAGRRILEDIAAGRIGSQDELGAGRLNIVSCPSCSRVENEAFVELAVKVREMTRYAARYPLTIAVMGCRVNGPGETDDADLGVWCGPRFVNLKRGGELLGRFSYQEILPRLKAELDALIASRFGSPR
ncbi:MAG TPA: flavodoxin-dependent (E)-4-hydroxy-3-methylbut-2-enyl-diphosphate synthase [Planctomycetes bacterium]|nr:flavodoxin-dependent (E)-4-hydroxy-3-methylbut-2-enyl-diphosphate synthase [Planctomycetota bacterium]